MPWALSISHLLALSIPVVYYNIITVSVVLSINFSKCPGTLGQSLIIIVPQWIYIDKAIEMLE